jgi:GAF domain-containing protein
MSGDSFLNTRCFTFPMAADMDVASSVKRKFTWPRNEDYGLNAESAGSDLTKEEAMSLALRYIGGRKRPEETLGFLAECSRILAGAADLDSRLEATLRLTAGYLADEVAVEIPGADGGPRSWSVANDAASGERSGTAAGTLGEKAMASRISHACLDARARLAENPERSFERALLDRGINALIVAPIAVRGEVIGTLSVARAAAADRTAFGPADLALAEELARRLSPELELARLRGSL